MTFDEYRAWAEQGLRDLQAVNQANAELLRAERDRSAMLAKLLTVAHQARDAAEQRADRLETEIELCRGFAQARKSQIEQLEAEAELNRERLGELRATIAHLAGDLALVRAELRDGGQK